MWYHSFEGWYFKHQKDGQTVALIPGRGRSGAFVQVITNERSWHFSVPVLRKADRLYAGDCVFSERGIIVSLPGIVGEISYGPLTRLRTNIMGPFQLLPMECRHGVISMFHSLRGTLCIQEKKLNLDGGLGYIEKDSGFSFPTQYLWLQCNAFQEQCSIMVSVARIPFGVLHFTGCICAIIYEGREYRLATYGGVRILQASQEQICLSQGRYLLEIDILEKGKGHLLKSPEGGFMTGMVRESNCTAARFRFWEAGQMVFDLTSSSVGFEYVS